MSYHTFTITLVALTFVATLSGCIKPHASPPAPDNQGKSVETQATEMAWHVSAQRSLGFFARVQAPFASNTQRGPGYCPALFLIVPEGSTRLDLNFTSIPLNTSKPSFGIQGFGARSDATKDWVEYPSITDDQRMWLDNPKRLSFDNPEPGKWLVHTFTYGAAYQQLGNLTIDLHGTSVAVPESLEIQMRFNSLSEC